MRFPLADARRTVLPLVGVSPLARVMLSAVYPIWLRRGPPDRDSRQRASTANLSSLSCASGTITGAGTDNCTVTLSAAAPSGGVRGKPGQ